MATFDVQNGAASDASAAQTAAGPPSLSVVYSFANEAEVLPEAIARVRTVLRHEQSQGNLSWYELIFVNDASSDASLEILRAAAVGNDDIRVLNMSRNFGVTPCVLAGFDYTSGDLVVYMDVDLQDPPEVIAELLQTWRERNRPDVVHTIRRVRDGESLVKKAITWLGYRILKRVSTVQLRIEAGDFKLLSRRVVDELCKLREKKPFMRGLVAWVGFRQTEIYYDRMPRAAGTTKFPVFSQKVIQNFFDSALISFSAIPLQIATLFGLLMSLAAFLYLIYVVIEKFLGHNIPGWSALMVTHLFLGGMQMMFLGIIGLYINAIFVEAKRRPNYIVDDTFGFPKDFRPFPERAFVSRAASGDAAESRASMP